MPSDRPKCVKYNRCLNTENHNREVMNEKPIFKLDIAACGVCCDYVPEKKKIKNVNSNRGGVMTELIVNIPLSESEIHNLTSAITHYTENIDAPDWIELRGKLNTMLMLARFKQMDKEK